MEIINKNIKILIVEDEVIVALEIKKTLEKYKFSVTDTVTNYYDAIDSVKSNEPDIIFMDIKLENSKDGVKTATKIKTIKDIPIIYLTAFSDEQTIYRAIETQPVSYIIKPFKREELKSSVLLGIYKFNNKDKQISNHSYTNIGYNYYYDFKCSNLFYKDEHIKLSLNERKFIELLIKAKGSELSFEYIEEQIWNDREVSESTLRTLVYRLSAKLEFKLIKSIPSYGYKLA